MKLINEVKRKREFSQLPDSIVERALLKSGNDVKNARAILRKYFGVFLTNRILKKTGEDLLENHLSSKKRDYEKFYGEIFGDKKFLSVVDIGAGVNGFSMKFLKEFGIENYYGIEASGQLVKKMNEFFKEKYYDSNYIWLDLFEIDEVKKIILGAKSPRVIFLFQIVDALESFGKNYSKKLMSMILENISENDKVIITLPIESLGGRKKFAVNRKWLVDFLSGNSKIEKDFEMNGERVVVIRKL